ncbi:MAG: Swt1 family HEPN domain-containing protein [Pseudomonadota bacterium]
MDDNYFEKLASTHADLIGSAGALSSIQELTDLGALSSIRELAESFQNSRYKTLCELDQDRFAQAAQRAFDNSKASRDLLDSLLKQSEVERLFNMASDYEDRFRLPDISEFSTLSEKLIDTRIASELFSTQIHMSEVEKAFEAMSTPWLDTKNTALSLNGFSELQAIGRILNTESPFDEMVAATLRDELGDWRNISTISEAIINDPLARTDFYCDLGFNNALTDFPAKAFDQCLDVARLRAPILPLVVPANDRGGHDNQDEEVSSGCNRTAYDLLFGFETELRNFIDKVMTQAFGERWVKTRVPGKVHQEWRKKWQRAKEKGEPVRPIIAYADFSDYIQIIVRKDNWDEVFNQFFNRKEDIQESFIRLYPIRICTMHARIITIDDELLLNVETKRILKAIGVVK